MSEEMGTGEVSGSPADTVAKGTTSGFATEEMSSLLWYMGLLLPVRGL